MSATLPLLNKEKKFMAKPNYSFEKRKKELDRQKKKDEKKARKGDQNSDEVEQGEGVASDAEAAIVEE
jgi:hypothetical protein